LRGAAAGRSQTVHRNLVLLALLSAVAVAVGGCGSSREVTPQALRLQRADLIAASRALSGAQRSAAAEVASTKAAWPLVVNGLPPQTSSTSRAAIEAASERAGALHVPGLFEEREAAALTGPSSGLAAAFRQFARLSARGWQLIAASIMQIEHGSPTASRFARANVALYIESVYDAHFGLAQIGKQLLAAYKKLGGMAAFGPSLTQAEVDALASSYSEANDRLHPHAGVRLGS
jgi:hypothetical protein